jgi:predicted transcriptional regulator
MRNILKVHEQNTIQALAAQGWSRRRIARELGLDRKTVRRYLSEAAKSPTLSTPGSAPGSATSLSTPGPVADSASSPGAGTEVDVGWCDPPRTDQRQTEAG